MRLLNELAQVKTISLLLIITMSLRCQSPKWKWRDSLFKLFAPEKVLLNNIRLKLSNKPARTLVYYCLRAISAVIWLPYKILKKVKGNRKSAAEILVPYGLLTISMLLLCNEVLKAVKMRSCSPDFMILFLSSISVNSLCEIIFRSPMNIFIFAI